MKHALFIPLGFYDYDNRIEEEIRKNGYQVDSFTPIGTYTFWEKVRNTLEGGRFLKKKSKRLQEAFFGENHTSYDLIFVIVGRHLEPEIFREFCKRNGQARKVLYLWDDVKRVENFHEIRDCFDDIYSFDHVDVEEYGFHMLPLFFTDSHRYENQEKIFRFALMGMLHSQRLSLFDKIVASHGLKEEECYVYLLGAKISHFLSWFHPFPKPWTGRRYIHANGMPFQKCADILKHTKVALDVQFGSQRGLTLRTLESLAAKTKLITTNEHVKRYDFYNENNICIIDRENPQVPADFFETDYESLPDELVEQYSLANWVGAMLER